MRTLHQLTEAVIAAPVSRHARRLTESVETYYHCGAKLKNGIFSLDFIGSGEGSSTLGPGIYLSSLEVHARVYQKYVKVPYLYTVAVDTSGLFTNVTGLPLHLREKLIALVESFGLRDPYRGVNSLRDGPGSIGAVFKHLGPAAGRKALIDIGITGAYEVLASGSTEIAVYDPTILKVLKSEKIQKA